MVGAGIDTPYRPVGGVTGPDDRRATLTAPVVDDGECSVKKGRHRRYEEARAMKRGPDLDIEAIFTDLESDRPPLVDDRDSSYDDDDPYDDRD